jgi:hypothetical protein
LSSSSEAATASGRNFNVLPEHADTENAQMQYDYDLCVLSDEGISIDKKMTPHYFKRAADQRCSDSIHLWFLFTEWERCFN